MEAKDDVQLAAHSAGVFAFKIGVIIVIRDILTRHVMLLCDSPANSLVITC
jgi:hypothetical protein